MSATNGYGVVDREIDVRRGIYTIYVSKSGRYGEKILKEEKQVMVKW